MRLYEIVEDSPIASGGRKTSYVDPSLNDIGIMGRQGPWKLLSLVDVTARDVNDPNDHSRQAEPKFSKQSKSHELLAKYTGRQLLHIVWKPQFKKILKQSGIYIWFHPRWGIFYIGKAEVNNLEDRWDTHIQKLMGRLHKKAGPASLPRVSTAPVEWIKFSEMFVSPEGSEMDITNEQIIKELEHVGLAFYQVEKPKDGYGSFLRDIEDRVLKSVVKSKSTKGRQLPTNKDAVKHQKNISNQPNLEPGYKRDYNRDLGKL
jgi:hypothetical protein